MKTQSKSAMLKKQMMSAISMMLAAAVALGSSTYAWFVNKSRAEVKDVLFQASAGKNLEIAGAVVENASHPNNPTKLGLDEEAQISKGKASLLTYWSSVTPQILGEHSFTYPQYTAGAPKNGTYMTPVSADGADLKLFPTRTTFFEADGWNSAAMNGTTAVGAYNTYTKVETNTSEKYICAQLYFRASSDMDVYLNKGEWDAFSTGIENDNDGEGIPFITYYNPSGATETDIAAYKMEAKKMASALRIAFVPGELSDGETDATTDTSNIKVAAFTNDSLDGDAYYNTQALGSNLVITSDTPIKTINASNEVASFGAPVTDTLDKYTLTGASVGVPEEVEVGAEAATKTPLFSLEANVPKRITIYIWLEGTDKDCVSAISAFRAGVYLPFVGTVENANGDIVTYSLDEQVEEAPVIE